MHVTLNCIDKKVLNKGPPVKALKLIRKEHLLSVLVYHMSVHGVTAGVSGVRLSYRLMQEVGESANSSHHCMFSCMACICVQHELCSVWEPAESTCKVLVNVRQHSKLPYMSVLSQNA